MPEFVLFVLGLLLVALAVIAVATVFRPSLNDQLVMMMERMVERLQQRFTAAPVEPDEAPPPDEIRRRLGLMSEAVPGVVVESPPGSDDEPAMSGGSVPAWPVTESELARTEVAGVAEPEIATGPESEVMPEAQAEPELVGELEPEAGPVAAHEPEAGPVAAHEPEVASLLNPIRSLAEEPAEEPAQDAAAEPAEEPAAPAALAAPTIDAVEAPEDFDRVAWVEAMNAQPAPIESEAPSTQPAAPVSTESDASEPATPAAAPFVIEHALPAEDSMAAATKTPTPAPAVPPPAVPPPAVPPPAVPPPAVPPPAVPPAASPAAPPATSPPALPPTPAPLRRVEPPRRPVPPRQVESPPVIPATRPVEASADAAEPMAGQSPAIAPPAEPAAAPSPGGLRALFGRLGLGSRGRATEGDHRSPTAAGRAAAESVPARPPEPTFRVVLGGDRRPIAEMAFSLGGEDPAEIERWRRALGTFFECVQALALEAGFLDPPRAQPFWGGFTVEQNRDIMKALASLGFRFDGDHGWIDDRVPVRRDISIAVGYAGVDPIRLRTWPRAEELATLADNLTIAGADYLELVAPGLGGPEVSAAVEPMDPEGELAELWQDWERVRPLLLAER